MARILSLDYGRKRTGIAVSDPLKIIATPLETVETKGLIGFLKNYFAKETVEKVIIGYPLNLDDTPTDATPLVEKFIPKFRHVFSHIPIEIIDERMSSKHASRSIAQMGLRRNARQSKELIDVTSAVLLLQEYMETVR